jgi:acid phosphatase type 7
MDRWALIRQLALGSLVFGATLVVLVGLTAVVGRSAAQPTASSDAASSRTPAPTAATATPTAVRPPATPGTTVAPSPDRPTERPRDPVLVGAGDIAGCATDGDEATAALLDGIAGTVFTAGDNAYDAGTAEAFRDCYDPTWGRHRDRTWPVPGNHDWGTPGLAGYREYFGDAATGPGGTSWYARDLGTWRVIALDSNCDAVGGCGPDSAQGRWLAAELAATSGQCTVAIFHHPRFSSGSAHGDDPAMDPLWRALYAAGVDVVVNGHDHAYERFAPQDPDGREDRTAGIRQFVVGTGGIELRGFGDPRPNSELRVSVAFGVLALTLRDGGYDWTFHAVGSAFSDRGTAACH